MRGLVFSVTLIATLAFTACGGGSNHPDSGIIIDEPDAWAEPACNPVEQTGCNNGEKCTWVTINDVPSVGITRCAPDGTQDIGEDCAFGDLNEADDCRAGGICISGACNPICSRTPDTCGEEARCNLFANTFVDQRDNVGACRPLCHPVEQTCPEDEACYLINYDGSGTCGAVPMAASERTQDDACFGPSPERCFLNGCARGFDTFSIPWDDFETNLCMQFCTPARSGLDADSGDQLDNLRGDPEGVVCGDYHPSAGEAANTECRFLNALLLSSNLNTPDWLGICLSEDFRTRVNLGSCTTHDLNAEPTTENVQNGTYVLGCEPLDDLQSSSGAQNASPAAIRHKQAEIHDALLEHLRPDPMMSLP